MYSEDTETENEDMLRKSMKQREQEFYGDDIDEPSTD